MATIRDVQRMQKANRQEASYEDMAALRDAAAEALGSNFARYRRNFSLGLVEWVDNQNKLSDAAADEINAEGMLIMESASVTANLDTGETRVAVFMFDGAGRHMAIRPGDQMMTASGLRTVSGENPFPSLEAAYDWLQSSPDASNGALPQRG